MKNITWQVQDDYKHENEKGDVIYTRGPSYTMKMSKSDQRIYSGAEIVSCSIVLIISAIVGIMIF
jgi:hypothetical protein